MNQMPTPLTMPIAQPGAPDVISPAEAQFWQEQAARTPALLHDYMENTGYNVKNKFAAGTLLTASLGAALAVATFTKHVPGKWKWVSGGGAVAAGGAAMLGVLFNNGMKVALNDINEYAARVASNPTLTQQLGDYLSKTVSGEDIQRLGLDAAVTMHALEFQKMMPLLQVQQSSLIGSSSANVPCR